MLRYLENSLLYLVTSSPLAVFAAVCDKLAYKQTYDIIDISDEEMVPAPEMNLYRVFLRDTNEGE